MTVEIDFLPFAIGVGAGVESQTVWASDTVVTNGFVTGIAQSTQVNKAVRQPSFVAAAIANYMGNVLNQNILDNGVLDTFWSQFWQSLLVSGSFTDSGTANAVVVAAPAGLSFPAPTAGLSIIVKIAAGNTGAATLNWMGNGNKPITYTSDTSLTGGELVAGGYAGLTFDGTEWQLATVAPAAVQAGNYCNRAVTITSNYSVITGDGGKNINIGANGLTVTFSSSFVTSANGPVLIGNYSGYSCVVTTALGSFLGGTISGSTSVTIPNRGWIAVEPDGTNLRIVAGDPSTIGAPGNFAVTSNASVGGTLTVTGAATLNSTINVSGAATLGNTLNVTGAATFNSSVTAQNGSFAGLTASGNANINGTLTVGGTATLQAVTGTSASFSGNLSANGTSSLNGNTTVGGTLTVSGNATLNSGLSVSGNASVGGTLGVTGITTLAQVRATAGVMNNLLAYTSSGSFTVPAGVYALYVILTGGGAGGLNSGSIVTGNAYFSGAGGGAGATVISVVSVTPGQVIPFTVGAAGAAQTNGGSSTFGALFAAGGITGGSAGGGLSSAGGAGGNGSGGLVFRGGWGTDGQEGSLCWPGNGGASYWGGGGRGGSNGGTSAFVSGAGGGGAYNGNTAIGGTGGPGILVIQY